MSQLKVMMSLTTHPQPPHIYPECWASILKLRWSGLHELVVEVEKFSEVLDAEAKIKNYSGKYMRIQQVFLASDCDALLTLESDHIYPVDALEKMAEVDADIVYGLYCSRPNMHHRWMLRRGESLGIASAKYSPKFMHSVWNKVVPSDGLGNGCTLIHRRVLETIQLTYSPGLGSDWHMAIDAKAAGFRQAHDCRVRVGHILAPGSVVWPDPDTTFKILPTSKGRKLK